MRSRCTRAAQKENTRPCGWAVFPLLVSETIDASSMHAACSVGAPCDVATVAALKPPDSPALLLRFRCPSVAFCVSPVASLRQKEAARQTLPPRPSYARFTPVCASFGASFTRLFVHSCLQEAFQLVFSSTPRGSPSGASKPLHVGVLERRLSTIKPLRIECKANTVENL